MASLLTDAEKKLIQSQLDDVRDTFFRDVYVYIKRSNIDSINDVPLDFNPLYSSPKQTTTHNTSRQNLEKFTIQAVVKYENNQDDSVVDARSQMNLSGSEGRVRLKVKKEAYEKLKIASRVEVDGDLYALEGDAKHIGPFDSQYYQVNLKREN
jgi:hypothetical protein